MARLERGKSSRGLRRPGTKRDHLESENVFNNNHFTGFFCNSGDLTDGLVRRAGWGLSVQWLEE